MFTIEALARNPHASPAAGNPLVTVNSRAAQRLRAGHVWGYRSDIVAGTEAPAGAAVDVADERGRALGTAFYSNSSVIALRLISRRPAPAADVTAQIIPTRIREAMAYREKIVSHSDAYRVVFSEADGLPGLIIDRYNDLIVMQALTQAFDRDDLRAVVLREITQKFAPRAIFERVDARVRALEKLPPFEDRLLWPASQQVSSAESIGTSGTVFSLNGVRFHFDALAGQKTGAFLDQRQNYAAAECYAHGHALDCFCYQGGFALHLARACSHVTGVDSSLPALEIAEKNALLNCRHVDWIEANTFVLLKDYAAARHQYDTIVLDPPAFAKSRSSLPTALRGYKELNLRAIKMLRPGGILVTCSCSHHVSEADFLAMLASAAADAGRSLRLLAQRGAALDHPAILTIPETSYLKCVICLAI